MRGLITGAAGFIGSRLAHRLLDEGYEVVGIDSLTDYYDPHLKRRNLDQLRSPSFRFVHADLNELDLAPYVGSADHVFHLAGQPGVRNSWGSDFALYVRANITATQRLLEACVTAGSVQRVVYASSSSVYGDAERYPTLETDRPRPRSPYGVTKLAAEHLCSLYAANFGLHTVSLRYFTVFGPGQRTDMAFHRFIRAALLDDVIDLHGSGQQIRDFTYVDDVVEANLRAAQRPTAAGTVLNVAGGTSVRLVQAIATIEEISGRTLRVNRLPSPPGDVDRTGGDTQSIKTALDWEPRVSLSDGLREQVAWMRSVLS